VRSDLVTASWVAIGPIAYQSSDTFGVVAYDDCAPLGDSRRLRNN
jgi:hypothetical protein